MLKKSLGLAALMGLLLAAPTLAQEAETPESATPTLKRTDAVSAEERLLQLSDVLGALHHLAPLCDPRTGEHWRDRMMELIRLERPSTAQRNAMVSRFNAAFNATVKLYKTCDAGAEAEAQAKAREGETLARSLSERIQ